jgi:hypothetical protein
MLNKFLRMVDHLLASPSPSFSSLKGEQKEKDPTIANFEQEYGFFSRHPLVGRVTKEEGDVELVCRALEKTDSRLGFWEVFAKALSYRELREGMEIPGRKCWFRVKKCWNRRGFVAFGLLSNKSNSPLLLFRGTDVSFSKNGFFSFYANLDFRSCGLGLFQHAWPNLLSWLKQFEHPALAVGYSLGGLLATYAALFDEPDSFSPYAVLSFNPPGIYSHLLKKIDKSKTEKVQTFIAVGDWISKVGHLIGHIHDWINLHSLGPIDAHTALFTGRNHFFHKR